MQGPQRCKKEDKIKTKYHVIHSWWLSSGTTAKEGNLGLFVWLGF